MEMQGVEADESSGGKTEKPKMSEKVTREDIQQIQLSESRTIFIGLTEEGDKQEKYFLKELADKTHIANWWDLYEMIKNLWQLSQKKSVNPEISKITVLITGWHHKPKKAFIPCPENILTLLRNLTHYIELDGIKDDKKQIETFYERSPKSRISEEKIKGHIKYQLNTLPTHIAGLLLFHENPSFAFYPKPLGEKDGLEDFFTFARGIADFTRISAHTYKFDKYLLRFVTEAQAQKDAQAQRKAQTQKAAPAQAAAPAETTAPASTTAAPAPTTAPPVPATPPPVPATTPPIPATTPPIPGSPPPTPDQKKAPSKNWVNAQKWIQAQEEAKRLKGGK